MRLETLYERELNFINRVEELGKFEYIEGYVNVKSPVKMRHKKCGCECYINAYLVAYSDIDMCDKCGRQVREFVKYKDKIEDINPHLNIKNRVLYKHGKCKYIAECKECGDLYFLSLDVLKKGNFNCCQNGISTYKKHCDEKAKDLYHKLKAEKLVLNETELYEYVEKELKEDDGYFYNKGLIDGEKIEELIVGYIRDRYKKDKVKICSCCGELKTGVIGWGRGEVNFNSGICLECAKASKKCSVCGESKRINRYSVENGKYADICQQCATRMNKAKK